MVQGQGIKMAFPDLYTTQNNLVRFSAVKSKRIFGDFERIQPFFSIVIPTYKRSELIIDSLKSALNQRDFDDYEIVVVDNNPDMNDVSTRNAIGSILHKRISYYVNEENIGSCGNWNRCVELAQGKYIVMLHDDDILGPNFLKIVHHVILRENEPGLIGVGYKVFDTSITLDYDEVTEPRVEQITKYGFFFNHYINITGMTFKRELAYHLGGFNPEYLPNIDTCFIYQGLIHSRVVNIKQTLAGYRIANNDSLNGNTMHDIIIMIERMREAIAVREKFARVFMALFDTEYLFHYISGANRYWKLQLEPTLLIKETEIKRKKISPVRMFLLKGFLRINPSIIKKLESREKHY